MAGGVRGMLCVSLTSTYNHLNPVQKSIWELANVWIEQCHGSSFRSSRRRKCDCVHYP